MFKQSNMLKIKNLIFKFRYIPSDHLMQSWDNLSNLRHSVRRAILASRCSKETCKWGTEVVASDITSRFQPSRPSNLRGTVMRSISRRRSVEYNRVDD